MSEGEWSIDEHRCWTLTRGRRIRIWIHPRPQYCDRGHYVAGVEGIPSIDGQDSFPRYFMDLERGKAEMAEWLEWRMQREASHL